MLFRSTPPHGGRPRRAVCVSAHRRRFDPRPRTGGDADAPAHAAGPAVFRSTPPRGGRPRSPARAMRDGWFRSTPPRGGRPTRPMLRPRSQRVSIHAPARGATPQFGMPDHAVHGFDPRPRAGGDLRVAAASLAATRFDPRPRAGGDRASRSIVPALNGFDPRPRAGGDVRLEHRGMRPIDVSIHAPARGATQASTSSRLAVQLFRSTPPRGGRRACIGAADALPSGFDPRPRAGGDCLSTNS